jgi:hypothetical protein
VLFGATNSIRKETSPKAHLSELWFIKVLAFLVYS